MKKFMHLSLFILFSLFFFNFLSCNLFFPETQEFVVIKKVEWNLIEFNPNDPEHEFEILASNWEIARPLIITSSSTTNEIAVHNTWQIQRAIKHFMDQGHKHIRLEKGNYYVGGRISGIEWAAGTQNWRNPEMIRLTTGRITIDGERFDIDCTGLNFDLDGSTLKLEPHDRMESRVILISDTSDIKIFNGTIIGDRVKHRYSDTYTETGAMGSHEWGSGIDMWGDVRNVELYDLTVSEVTGDCIGANGFNITIRNCNISRGRRNGIVSVYVDGLTIHDNKIHCIYMGGVEYERCHYCNVIGKTGNHPSSQHEYFGGGIGAEACIAFEHTTNNYFDRQINIKIYNNYLDGQKPLMRTNNLHPNSAWRNREYLRESALNTHWGTYAMWVYNNDIIGDWEWSAGGSNTLIENNRFLGRGYKGYVISRGLIASGSILETGRSAANYVVIRNNYFENYNVIVGGASGGVSDSQPHWRHDYAIVDNIFVYNEPRHFYLNDDGNPVSTNYYTGICVSVNNSVVMGNVFDVRDGGHTGLPPHNDWQGNPVPAIKPLACAIYIDVVNSDWSRRIPDNLKVDMYIAGNTFIGPIWRQKYYVLNNGQGLQALNQYEKPADPRMPSNFSETNNLPVTYAKYKEILSKTISVGNIWRRVK